MEFIYERIIRLFIYTRLFTYSKIFYNIYINLIEKYISLIATKFGLKYFYVNFKYLLSSGGHVYFIPINNNTYIKHIYISYYLITRKDWYYIKDIILHEISHALLKPNDYHNNRWKQTFIKIGGSGNTYMNCKLFYDSESYKLICRNCKCMNYNKIFNKYIKKKYYKQRRCYNCGCFCIQLDKND